MTTNGERIVANVKAALLQYKRDGMPTHINVLPLSLSMELLGMLEAQSDTIGKHHKDILYWKTEYAHQVNIAALFASGIGDSREYLIHKWDTLPKDMKRLAIPVTHLLP